MFLLPPLKCLHNGCEHVRRDEPNVLKLTHKDAVNKMGDFTASLTRASPPGHPQPVMTGISKTESWLKRRVMALHIDASLEPLLFSGRKRTKKRKEKK